MGKIVQFHSRKRTEGEHMCDALRKIQGLSAEKLLYMYGNNTEVPINLDNLLKNIGIISGAADFTKIEKKIGAKKGQVLGMLLAEEKQAAILYRKADGLNRKRFTIAHELAHCCLREGRPGQPHIEFRLDDKDKDEHERKADIFAGALLIPLDLLAKEHMKMPIPNSRDLADIFAVSISVMEARLDYLKISYYNKDWRAVIY